MKIDITKTAHANTLALVLFSNPGLIITADKVGFDTLTVLSGVDGRNTTVRVYAEEGKGLSGHVTVAYYRPALFEQTPLPSLDYEGVAGMDPQELLINVCTALEVSADEVVWETYVPGEASSTTECILAAKETSLLYQGRIFLSILWKDLDT